MVTRQRLAIAIPRDRFIGHHALASGLKLAAMILRQFADALPDLPIRREEFVLRPQAQDVS